MPLAQGQTYHVTSAFMTADNFFFLLIILEYEPEPTFVNLEEQRQPLMADWPALILLAQLHNF